MAVCVVCTGEVLHEYVNGGYPPVITAVAVPFVKPEQLTLLGVVLTSAVKLLMNKLILSVSGGQPRLLVVVSVIITLPLVISAEDGVYVTFKDVSEGVNTPVPVVVQIPVVTPVTVPVIFTTGLSAQPIMSGPALVVIGAANEVTVTEAVVAGHCEVSLTVTVYVPGPA